MAGFFRAILLGRLTRDVETRFDGKGQTITKFALACDRTWVDKDGEKHEVACFVDVTFFGKRGEAFAKFHDKGKMAFIEGEIRTDTWKDKETGKPRYRTYVMGTNWEFADKSNNGAKADFETGREARGIERPIDDTPY